MEHEFREIPLNPAENDQAETITTPVRILQDNRLIAYEKRKRKKGLLIKAAVVVLSGLILIYLASAVFGEDAPENPEDYDPVTLDPKPPEGIFKKITHFVFSKDVSLEGERDDRINVLLMGIGGPGHDGPYLADTIVLLSLKPSTQQIAMVSIPRDLSVDIPDFGQNKINAASAYGEKKRPGWGGALTTEVVEKTFDIKIPYYVRVDFNAFKEIIDTVGGISVNVERSFNDPLFPAKDNGYQTVSFTKGQQAMDGAHALLYARSRHGSNGEGSDFARAKRQQKVILALKEKILSASTLTNPIRIHSILTSLDNHISTNMEFSEMIAFTKMAKNFDTSHILTIPLDNSEQGMLRSATDANGAYVLLPKSGSFNIIQKSISNIFDPNKIASIVTDDTPKQTVQTSDAKIEVQNGTWQAGLAARVKKKLSDQGFDVTTIGNTDQRPMEKSAIYALNSNIKDEVYSSLSNTLHISLTKIENEFKVASSTDILIILGEDFEADNR